MGLEAKIKLQSLLLLLTVLGLFYLAAHPPVAAADVWKYVDNEGKSHFVDKPEKVPEAYRDQLKDAQPLPPIVKAKPARERLYEQERYRSAPAATTAKVEVFVADWCSYCKSLEAYLKKERIQYVRRDIERDAAAARFVTSRGGGIPVTRIGDTVISGYKPEAISRLVKKK